MSKRHADLLAAEEPPGPDHLVADPGRRKGVLDAVHDRAPPGEYRDVALWDALLDRALDLERDPSRLLGVRGRRVDQGLRPVLCFLVCFESHRTLNHVVSYQRVRDLENLRGVAVVPLQRHDRGAGVFLLESEDQPDIGQTEPIDHLLVVPHDHQAPPLVRAARQKLQETRLCRVGVLILVN